MVLGDGAMRPLAAPIALVALVAAFLNACGEPVVETLLPLPEASSIEKVIPTTRNIYGTEISNQKDVAGILEVLDSISPGWELVTDPSMIPTPSIIHSVQMTGGGSVHLVLWIGPDWIGANNMQGGTSVRQGLVDPKRKELLRKLGIEN